MKILWFTLTPCGSVRRNMASVVRNGWLIALEDAMKKYCPDIDLTVAYVSNNKEESFYYDRVHYIPMYEDKGKGNPAKRILRRYDSNKAKGKRLLPLMLDAVKEAQPDLIHIHGTEERFGLISDYVKNIPIAYSIQGLIAPLKEQFWSGIPKSFFVWNESLQRRFRHITYLQTYKDFSERALRELHYLENAKYILGRTFWDRRISLLCNPNVKYFQAEELMRSDFYEQKWEEPKGNKTFRIVSTISNGVYKGHETILHAAYLLKRYGRFDFEWCVAGCTNDDIIMEYAMKYKDLRPTDCNIRLMGYLSSEQLSILLYSSNLYCQVSHIENSPNSLCEALLFGMPTIASFAGGTASLTKGDESEAVLYQDGDPYALAGSIVDVHDNYDLYIRKGEKARQSALVRHNPQRVATQYQDIYNQIAEDFYKRNRDGNEV